MKDHNGNQITARSVGGTDEETLECSDHEHAKAGTKAYTDDTGTYKGLANYESVKHSVGELVRGMAHTNGFESQKTEATLWE